MIPRYHMINPHPQLEAYNNAQGNLTIAVLGIAKTSLTYDVDKKFLG